MADRSSPAFLADIHLHSEYSHDSVCPASKIYEAALEKGIDTVVFDRGGYLYHGRVKALAEGAREGGLKF